LQFQTVFAYMVEPVWNKHRISKKQNNKMYSYNSVQTWVEGTLRNITDEITWNWNVWRDDHFGHIGLIHEII